VTWLGGPVERLMAISKRRAVSVDIDDTTSALMSFSSGATGYLGSNFACPYTSFLNLYGTKVNAFAGVDANTLSVQRPEGSAQAVELVPVDTLRAELEEFAAACRGMATFRVLPEEAIHNVAVMEAIVRSAAEGSAPVVLGSN